MTYLDYNATTPVLPEVVEAMLPYFSENWGNPSSPHAAGKDARSAVERARSQVAALLGVTPGEIIFTSGATESNQTILRAFAADGLPVIFSTVEHQSVLSALTDNDGIAAETVDVDTTGQVDVPAINERTGRGGSGLLALIWANNETGIVSPVREASLCAKEHGWNVHLDGAQIAGKLPIDAASTEADYVALSAHKIYGPKGIGALYVRQGSPFRCLLHGTQESGRRGGTESVPLIVGFGEAARLARRDLDERCRTVRELRDRLESEILRMLEGASVNGQGVDRLPNTASVRITGVDADVLVSLLSERDICISSGSACKSSAPTPSHVLLAMGHSYEDAGATIRISLSHLNSEKDVAVLLAALQEAVPMLRA